MITAQGHLKFVDFGTCKDLLQTDLNGPEFVGTPEYMSPSTIKNKNCGVEVRRLYTLSCCVSVIASVVCLCFSTDGLVGARLRDLSDDMRCHSIPSCQSVSYLLED